MADYSALWTSSGDREFQQIKKVKQLTERHLAMHVSNVEKSHRRSMKKTRDQIRESITTLEELEKEKEKRARQILATYFKHQRMKEAASVWKFKFQSRRNSEAANAKNSSNNSARPSLLQLFQKAAPDSSPDTSPRTLNSQSSLTIPKIQLEGREIPRNSDRDSDVSMAIQGVHDANIIISNQGKFLSTPSAPDTSYFGTGLESDELNRKPRRDSITKTFLNAKERSNERLRNKAENVADNRPNYMSPNRTSRNRIGIDRKRSPVRPKMGDKTKRLATHSKVIMTHTFPYVYHSHGEKPCPRYGLFRECTDYDPFINSSSSRRPSKMSPSRKASVFSTTNNNITTSSEIPNRKASFNRVATAIKVAQALHHA